MLKIRSRRSVGRGCSRAHAQVERERAALEHRESNSLFETDAELQRQREEEERLRLQKEEEDASREAPLTALCGLL